MLPFLREAQESIHVLWQEDGRDDGRFSVVSCRIEGWICCAYPAILRPQTKHKGRGYSSQPYRSLTRILAGFYPDDGLGGKGLMDRALLGNLEKFRPLLIT